MRKKKVLITGITGGFGEILRKTLENDFDVYGTTTQKDKCTEKVFFLDFMNSPFPQGEKEIYQEWEAVILNAGMAVLGNPREISFFEMFKMMQINVVGPWDMMKKLDPKNKKVVFISSSCSLDLEGKKGLEVYGCTKNMMESLLKSMFEKGLLILYPGPMDTGMKIEFSENMEKEIWRPQEEDWENPYDKAAEVLSFLLN